MFRLRLFASSFKLQCVSTSSAPTSSSLYSQCRFVCCGASTSPQTPTHSSTHQPHISSRSMASSSSSSSNCPNELQPPDAKAMVTFLEHIGKLKHIKRTGWVIRAVKDCESVASHMYRMSIMTYLLDGVSTSGSQPDGQLDRIKCLEMALVHDMAESIVGDLTPYCGVSKADKLQREMDAMQTICQPLGSSGERLMALFMEYEQHETAEAKFVKELDRLDMVLQAHEYETRDQCPGQLQEFFDSTADAFTHPLIVGLVQQIKANRQQHLDNKPKD